MNISGWAFTANEEALRDERYNRFKELSKEENIKIDSVMPSYGRTTYKGTILNESLSELDILLLWWW